MSNVDTFRNEKGQGDYWGVCPSCGHNDGYVNVGRVQVLLCNEHKVAWIFGENLFSSWRYEWEESGIESYDDFMRAGSERLDDFTMLKNGEQYHHPAQVEYMKKMNAHDAKVMEVGIQREPNEESDELPF